MKTGQEGYQMKRGWRCIYTIGGVATLCVGASFVKDYRNMERMEKSLNSLPLHKLKEKFSDIQEDEEKTVLIIPKGIPVLERLRACRHVLHGNIENRDACRQ